MLGLGPGSLYTPDRPQPGIPFKSLAFFPCIVGFAVFGFLVAKFGPDEVDHSKRLMFDGPILDSIIGQADAKSD
jgi:hypothetical protein